MHRRFVNPLLFTWFTITACAAGESVSERDGPSKPAAAEHTEPVAQPDPDPVVPPEPAEPAPVHPLVIDAPGRLVAIGDVHGDLAAFERALELAGAIDGRGRWIGGDLTVVQTGDQLDRGNDEPEILELIDRLRAEASATGGRFVALNGNHEIMNVEGDLRYATDDGCQDYDDPGDPGARRTKTIRKGCEDRASQFSVGKPLARRLARRPVAVIVDRTLFVHGGVEPSFANRATLRRANNEAASWMWGDREKAPAALRSRKGLVWSRRYSDDDAPDTTTVCQELTTVLERLDVDRMVMGHTVHRSGINAICDGRAWRIDTGMAAAYGGPTQVWQLDDGVVNVLR